MQLAKEQAGPSVYVQRQEAVDPVWDHTEGRVFDIGRPQAARFPRALNPAHKHMDEGVRPVRVAGRARPVLEQVGLRSVLTQLIPVDDRERVIELARVGLTRRRS